MDIAKYLEDNSVKFKPNNSGYLILEECVFCDGKNKLGISLTNEKRPFGFVKCFKCGKTGMFDIVIEVVSKVSNEVAKKIFYGTSRSESPEVEINPLATIFKNLEIQQNETTTDKINKFQFIKNAKLIIVPKIDFDPSLLEEGREYLKRRGLNDSDIDNLGVVIYPSDYELVKKVYLESLSQVEKTNLYNAFKKTKEKLELSYDETESYEEFRKLYGLTGRVVFPVKIGKKSIGYVARDYTGKSDTKVLNSTGPMTTDFFWNFNGVNKTKQLIILEGIFSAVSCGINRSIAVLGMHSILGENKLKLMASIDPEEYVIFFDPGAIEMSGKLAKELAKTGKLVKIVLPPTVLKCKEQVFLDEILNAGIDTGSVDYGQNCYYLSHMDHSILKLCIKAINHLRMGDFEKERKIINMVDYLKSSDPIKRKKFYYVYGKIKNSASIEREVKKLSEGSFLDANDLGIEYCDFLIKTAIIYRHQVDYKIYDRKIIKYVHIRDRELQCKTTEHNNQDILNNEYLVLNDEEIEGDDFEEK